jgi:hypothetical protein
MFGLFKTATFTDEALGQLQRSGGLWRGHVRLDDGAPVRLVISGSRERPDAEALNIARAMPGDFPVWRPGIAEALFEHYQPYAEAVAAGEEDAPAAGLPEIQNASDVWPHTVVDYVQVAPLDGALTVEIGLRAAWDEEHLLGVQIRDGRVLGLNGSVLAP